MVIDINTDNLINSGLSPNQYVISILIYERAYNTLETLKLHFPEIIEESVAALLNKEIIIEASNRIGYTTTDKFSESILHADFFDNLLSVYPVFVVRNGNNKDYLRTDRSRCRKKYAKITRNKKSIHNHIIKCLEFEITTRQNEGTMSFMKRLPNWLDGKEWESWAERMEHEAAPIKQKAYGTDLE